MNASLISGKSSLFSVARDKLHEPVPVPGHFRNPIKTPARAQRLSFDRQRRFMRCLVLMASTVVLLGASLVGFVPTAEAVVVNPGDVVPLTGTTAASSPDLAGPVQSDPLLPFRLFDNLGNLILSGNVQDRATRSGNLGTLIFEPRLRDLDNHGSGAFVTGLRVQGYGGVTTNIDFRTDGVGDVGPNDVTRSTSTGDQLTFRYDPNLIDPPQEAYFLSILTDASSFAPLGTITVFAQNDFGADVFSTTLSATNGPVPDIEVDVFPDTRALVGIMLPDGSVETLSLRGPSIVEVHLGRLADTDGNGREQVPTEMVQLELIGNSPTLGPVALRLRDPALPPFMRSTGEIEENLNNTPGVLDIPPFTATGTADSFFDVFFEVEVGGQVLHSETPSRMESTISHKPPAPGNTYNKPPGVIPLFDKAGNDTGIKIVQASHEPNPGNIEVDIFPDSFAVLDINGPLGPDTVKVIGPTTVEVEIFNLTDPDGDTREQVPTEIVAMQLTGNSALYGLVTMRLRDAAKHPFMRSTGEIEERTNTQTGRLDLPPFAPDGTADSFFDVFFEVEVAGMILHNWVPKRMQQVITYKPPLWGQFYENLQTIELYDENNQPTGITIGANRHIPDSVEVDFFPDTRATVELFCTQPPVAETITLQGPTTVEVDLAVIADTDGDTREQVPTEIVAMQLTGESSLGPVILRQSPTRPSHGEIEETTNNTPGVLDLPPFTSAGTADSFFDVFFEIELPDGSILHNDVPKHMNTVINHKPPAAGDAYEGIQVIDLLDPNGNPTGCVLGANRHLPEPIEVDHFPDSRAVIELIAPTGAAEIITLNGPTTVEVDLGALVDTDGNGREQVPTEIVALQLAGNSSMGPVLLNQSPTMPTLGEIEETTNNTPGVLDLPPFTPTGTADSFFDVFFEIVLPDGTILHNRTPKHLRARITHKPPAELEFYETINRIPLFFSNGTPSGFEIGAGRHIPRPVEVDHFPDSLATVALTCPNLPTELVALRGPTTVVVDLWDLADTNGNNREQVPTEIIDLHLTGVSPTLGLITLRHSPIVPTLGEIEETTNTQTGRLDLPPFAPAGTADSFFDVFFEIDVPGVGLLLHNRVPKHLRTRITHKPPTTGEVYEGLDKIALFDPAGNPTGCNLGATHHIPSCPAGPDSDQDGIPDACDNCIRIPNGPLAPDAGGHSQRDTNGDGYGNICDPDFNGDVVVNAADLAYMKTHFFTADADADLTGDGIVNAADLAILKTMFFNPPGPSCCGDVLP